jgi:hypothetical protein
MAKKNKICPLLQAALSAGTVFEENGEYVGFAEDGTIVSLGSVGFEKQCESYLSAHPTPDTW